MTLWQDQAEVLNDRLTLMLRNGATGFALVFIVLALFLELRLAFWVSLGIPLSFLGAIALMPGLDVSVNVISLSRSSSCSGSWSTTPSSSERTSTVTRKGTGRGCAGRSRARERSASRSPSRS